MRIFVFILLLCFTKQVSSQTIIESYIAQKDSLQTGPGKNDFIPFNDKGYTLILPDSSKPIAAVIISFEDRKFDHTTNPSQQIYKEAMSKNMAVLYVSTGIPLDLFFSVKSIHYVDATINAVFAKHHLPSKNIFFLGVNLSAHRSLKYIEYCKRNHSKLAESIRGIVLCDGVLDWVRQWHECKKAIRDHVAESSVFEGKLVTHLLEKNLGGTPKNKLENYLNFSSYSYFDDRNRHLDYFKPFAIRAYTEPATHYWMNVKGKTTFDTNFPDMVGIINEMKLAGNQNSELILFNQDKNNADKRNPNYTWGLVDKTDLVNWMASQLDNAINK